MSWHCQVDRERDTQRICGIARAPGRYLCQRGEEFFHYGGVIHDTSETNDAMRRAYDRRDIKLEARFQAKRQREDEEFLAR